MRTHAMRLMQAALAGVASLMLVSSAVAQTTIEYYHTDALGSVRVVTDAAGNLLRQHDYWPFGAEVNPPPNECTDVHDPRGFTGQQRDKETCQDYFGGRYYRSGTRAGGPPRASGRFTSPDPVLDLDAAIVDPQRWNRYAYAVNNPSRYVDPDGRDPVTIGAGIGAVVYAGWRIGTNVYNGRAWYDNVGVEAAKGLIVGASLGVLAPAVGLPSASALAPVLPTSALASPRVLNSANHIFGAKNIAEHRLEGFLESFNGNAVQAFSALEQAAQRAANQGLVSGIFETVVRVGGQDVTVRGRVIEGVVRVTTAFIPG